MGKFVEAATKKEAIRGHGNGYAICKKACGGWVFFDSIDEYKIWCDQK